MKSKSIQSLDLYGNTYHVTADQLTWRPAAYAIIVADGKILLMKERGLFHMPGGGIDLGELPEDGVIREVKEETGLTVTNPRLAGTLSTFFTHTRNPAMEAAHVQSLLLYFHCDVIDGSLSTDGLEEDEKLYGLEPEWVSIEDIDTVALGSTVDWRPIAKHAMSA